LEDFTPDVEHYSIDEVFVKMPMSSWHLDRAGDEEPGRLFGRILKKTYTNVFC
jgi:nucleotidyltransferase/DNA polymerase involved in DNA repair